MLELVEALDKGRGELEEALGEIKGESLMVFEIYGEFEGEKGHGQGI